MRSAITLRIVQDFADFCVIGARREKKIDEAGPGDLDLVHRRTGGQQPHQGLREPARILTRRLGESHGEIAGEIAVLRVAGAVHFHTHGARGLRHRVFGKRSKGLRDVCAAHGLHSQEPGGVRGRPDIYQIYLRCSLCGHVGHHAQEIERFRFFHQPVGNPAGVMFLAVDSNAKNVRGVGLNGHKVEYPGPSGDGGVEGGEPVSYERG